MGKVVTFGRTLLQHHLHMSIGMTPFRALYGYDAPTLVDLVFAESKAPKAKDWIIESQVIELELPEGRKIHNLFHLSCLKKAVGQFISTSEELPPLDEEGQLELVIDEVLEFWERKLRSRVIRECLIRWRGLPVEDATWESEQVLQHPRLVLLEDKQFQEGRTVMSLSK
jgi:hypothetical protein